MTDLEQGAEREPAEDGHAQPGGEARAAARGPLAAADGRLGDALRQSERQERARTGWSDAGCHRLLLMALYPQYAAPTTATAYDKAFDALKADALAAGPAHHGAATTITRPISRRWRTVSASILPGSTGSPTWSCSPTTACPKRLLLSGDPYHCHCQKTTRLVREELGWAPERMMVCFQSRFGSEEWLQPYLDKTMEALPGAASRRSR